jgi:hypothetical protein
VFFVAIMGCMLGFFPSKAGRFGGLFCYERRLGHLGDFHL